MEGRGPRVGSRRSRKRSRQCSRHWVNTQLRHEDRLNLLEYRANAFALFVKSQRKWTSPPLTAASVEAFKSRMEQYGYSSNVVLPHGSYLINLGNPDEYVNSHGDIKSAHAIPRQKRQKSYECFVDDLKRCEQLGLQLYNFQ